MKMDSLSIFSMIIARCSVRDRCNQNDREHFVGNIIATIHVRGHGSPNVQGRGHFFRTTLKDTIEYKISSFYPTIKSRVTTQSGVKTRQTMYKVPNFALTPSHKSKISVITPLGTIAISPSPLSLRVLFSFTHFS